MGQPQVGDELFRRGVYPPALQECQEDDHTDGNEDDQDNDGREHLLEGEAPFIPPHVFDLRPQHTHDPLRLSARRPQTLSRRRDGD